MDEISPTPPSPVADLQREVQRKLGRCLLRIQQYERQLKAVVSFSALRGPADQLQMIQEKNIACAQSKTLGALVGMLTENHLVPEGKDEDASETESSLYGESWVSYRQQLGMPAEQYESTKAALKELVALRNGLVHHFLERFDLWSEPSCLAADGFLDQSYATIDIHYLKLRDWAKSLDELRFTMASFLGSQAFEDMFDGINADGSIQWPISGICSCLRSAESELARGGWTPLEAAIRWIGHLYPKETPKRYGCSSWRQVLYESRQFEVRKVLAEHQRTAILYRSKAG